MTPYSLTEIPAFKSAYQLLIRTAKRSVNTINQDPNNLAIFCQTLSKALENEDIKIHIVGEGRSGIIGEILGECLKDIGFSNRLSYLGKNLAKPVKKNDIIIALTGSGWTKFTTAAIEDGIRKKCKILTFTGAADSKAAKLSNAIIHNPLGFQPQDYTYQFTGQQTPLSPLGTIFELTTMVTGIGVINGVYSGSCTKGFNEGTSNLLRAAEKTFDDLEMNPKISNFIRSLSDYSKQMQAKVFFHGNGISNIICRMSSIRFQSLGLNIHQINDWRFRQKGDLFVALSGSGASSKTLEMVKSAKTSQMTVYGITSFPQSELAKNSDEFLVIHGRMEKENPDNLQTIQPSIFLPTFEYIASITLEAFVAQIAVNLGINEDTS